MLDIPKEDPQIRRLLKLVREEGYRYEDALKEVGADYFDEQKWEYFGFNQREGDYRDFYDFRHPTKSDSILSYSSNSKSDDKWEDLKCYMSFLLPLILIFGFAIIYGLLK